MKRFLACSVLLPLLLLCLPGCWDRTEINDLAFILTTAVDAEPDGQLRITVLLPLPGQMGGATGGGGGTGGEKSYYIDSEVGHTFREAQSKLQARMSRRMFLAHRRTLLVGEDYAKTRGIRDLFDAAPRSPESRMTTFMIVTKGKAYDLLNSKPSFERFPSEAIRELAKTRTVMQMNMKDIALSLSNPGSDPVLLYMGVQSSKKSGKPSREVTDLGYALFKDDRMIGVMDKKKSLGIAWLKDEKSEAAITVGMAENQYVTAKVTSIGSHIRVQPRNGKLTFDMEFNARATLFENSGYYDLSQTSNVRKVENALSAHVKSAIQDTIDMMKKNAIDPVQFGMYVWRAYPKVWTETYASDWPAGLQDADYHLNVSVVLSESGLIYGNVTKEGKQE